MAAEIRKRKLRPWAEAARLVLGSQEALSITEIFERIIERGLRDTTPGSKECLFSMMRAHSRGQHSLFYRRIEDDTIAFGLRNDLPPSTMIVETDVDTDDESQKHDSRYKPKIQLLKTVIENESENVAPTGIMPQLPLKRRSANDEQRSPQPPPKRCLRPKPQREVRTSYDQTSISSDDGTLSPTSSSGDELAQEMSPKRHQTTIKSFMTMRETMSTLTDHYGIKFNRTRPTKKSSMSQQLEESRKGLVDLENPESILVNVNIKELLSSYAFSLLDRSAQGHLLKMLPQIDQKISRTSHANTQITVDSALNNEFFASACQEWRERLIDGDLTPESQLKQKADYDRHIKSVDPWKLRHFEDVWGARARISREDIEFHRKMIQQHEAQKLGNEVANGSSETESTSKEISTRVEVPVEVPVETPAPQPVETKAVKKENLDSDLAKECARISLMLPHLTSSLCQSLAESGVPVSTSARRKCNNIVPPSLCLSAKRIGIGLIAPARVHLHAPIGIPRRRLSFYNYQSSRSDSKLAVDEEAMSRFNCDCKHLEANLNRLEEYMGNPFKTVPLDVQETITDIVNLVDIDRISDYPMYGGTSYSTSTLGTPSHNGTVNDEICGSELMFSVTTDEDEPTDDMSDQEIVGNSSVSEPNQPPAKSIDSTDGLLYMDVLHSF